MRTPGRVTASPKQHVAQLLPWVENRHIDRQAAWQTDAQTGHRQMDRQQHRQIASYSMLQDSLSVQ